MYISDPRRRRRSDITNLLLFKRLSGCTKKLAIHQCWEKPRFPSQTFWIPPNSPGNTRRGRETPTRGKSHVSLGHSWGLLREKISAFSISICENKISRWKLAMHKAPKYKCCNLRVKNSPIQVSDWERALPDHFSRASLELDHKRNQIKTKFKQSFYWTKI